MMSLFMNFYSTEALITIKYFDFAAYYYFNLIFFQLIRFIILNLQNVYEIFYQILQILKIFFNI
jgi:hypothetical protein